MTDGKTRDMYSVVGCRDVEVWRCGGGGGGGGVAGVNPGAHRSTLTVGVSGPRTSPKYLSKSFQINCVKRW